MEYNPEESVGRSKLRWKDQVLKDHSSVGEHQDAAEDRNQWRIFVNEAKNTLSIWKDLIDSLTDRLNKAIADIFVIF